jgi:perosamine synthetase
MIPIFEPELGAAEQRNVAACMASGWISSQGPFVGQFEEALAAWHEMPCAVATSSCTTALHLALKALDIGPGDEVICPDLTFIAPANMIQLAGATPVLVDVDPNTLNLDPARVEAACTAQTRALLVVHQFGHAAPMPALQAIAADRGLKIIEDNAESIGGRCHGELLGTIGDISCFSFFANKVITTGEGGAILTRDPALAERCQVLRDHGMARDRRYTHIDLGYNYRMTNLQAAVGVAQIARLDDIVVRRQQQLDRYTAALTAVAGLRLRRFADWCKPVHWMMTITLDDRYDRDAFLQFMREHDVDCRQMINPVHEAEHFAADHAPADFPVATAVAHQSVHLPSSTHLRTEQLDLICQRVRTFLEHPSGAAS